MKTSVKFNSEARAHLLKGMNIVADAVGCTLGPRGKTVIIQSSEGAPIVTKDGVTVSKSISFKDPILNMGARLIQQAAEQTNEIAGDGTTTSTVLTYAMVSEGNKYVNNGAHTQRLIEGIKIAIDIVIDTLSKQAKKIESFDELAQIATISANGDKEIGRLLADAMEKVGKNGIITIEDAKGTSTSLSLVEGLQFDRGYLSPYFVTNQEKMNVVYENCAVLITDKKLSSLSEIVPILEKTLKNRLPLLIIADDVEAEALNGIVLNRVKNNMPIVAVKAPSYGTHRENILADLCILTGARLVSSKTGLSLDKVDIVDLGKLNKCVVDSKTTTLVTGARTDAVTNRINELTMQLSDETADQTHLSYVRQRIAGLSSGVACIKVGGSTEVEMIEKRHRIEDALNATRAAADEGIVVGGGQALLMMTHVLEPLKNDIKDTDVVHGIDVVIKACQAPLRTMTLNAGVSPDIILDKALNLNPGMGYDGSEETYKNMFDAGIIDPVKVSKTALKNAASVATTFLSLDAVIYEDQQ